MEKKKRLSRIVAAALCVGMLCVLAVTGCQSTEPSIESGTHIDSTDTVYDSVTDTESSAVTKPEAESESYIETQHVHVEMMDVAMTPTCVATGLTEGKHCVECGEILVGQEIIPKKPHEMVNNRCVICHLETSQGLSFALNGDDSYSVAGIGSCQDTYIVIPISYNGKLVKGISNGAFYDCSGVMSVLLPENILYIGDNAFSGCSSLVDINIPDSVTSIGAGAFSGCSSLMGINIPDSITSIEAGTFSGCSSLASIQIPKGVTFIGERAFSSCSQLRSVEILDDVSEIGYMAFSDCRNLESFTTHGIRALGDGILSGCNALTNLTIYASPVRMSRLGLTTDINTSLVNITVTYYSTMAQWNKTSKGSFWENYTGSYTVHCIDGDITRP